MAGTQEDWVRFLRDLDSSDSSVKRSAQEKLDKIPLNDKVDELAWIIGTPSHSMEDKAAAAKHLAHLFAWKGKEYFTSLSPPKETIVYKMLFSGCIEPSIGDYPAHLDELLTAIAHMVHVSVNDCSEAVAKGVARVLGQYVTISKDENRRIGWTILSRVTSTLRTPEFIEWMVKDIPQDLASEEVETVFAAAVYVFSYILEGNNSILEKLAEPLGSAVEELLHEKMYKVKVLELLFAVFESGDRWSSSSIFGEESEEVADVLLELAKDPEEPNNIRVLCLKLLPKVRKESMKKAMSVLCDLINQQLFTNPGVESDLLEDLQLACSSFDGDLLKEMLPTDPLTSIEETASVVFMGIYSKEENFLQFLLPLLDKALSNKEVKVRRVYALLQKRLVCKRDIWADGGQWCGRVHGKPSLFLKESDEVTRSLMYEAYVVYLNKSHSDLFSKEALLEVLPLWVAVLESEANLMLGSAHDGSALEQALIVIKKVLSNFPDTGVDVGCLLSALKDVSEMETARSSGVALAVVDCAVVAVQKHTSPILEKNADWMLATLEQLHQEMLKAEVFPFQKLVQTWQAFVEASKQSSEVLGKILPTAVATLVHIAAVPLPLQEVENCLGAEKIQKKLYNMYLFPSGRRLICFDQAAFQVKMAAIEQLDSVMNDYPKEVHSVLPEIAGLIGNLLVEDFGKGFFESFRDEQFCEKTASCPARALQALETVLSVACQQETDEGAEKIWKIVQPAVMQVLAKCASGKLFTHLGKCVGHLPEELVSPLVPLVGLNVERTLGPLHPKEEDAVPEEELVQLARSDEELQIVTPD